MTIIFILLLIILNIYFLINMAIIWNKNQYLIEKHWVKNDLPFINNVEQKIINKWKYFFRRFAICSFILGIILFYLS